MLKRNSKSEFIGLLTFLVITIFMLSNGFIARIAADSNVTDVYQQVEPIGDVLSKILQEYVHNPDMEQVVEGALIGMMGSLDRHSSFIPEKTLRSMREDTRGEFEGIGVSIKEGDDGGIMVYAPIIGSPASEAGIMPFDIIIAIDGQSAEGMSLSEAADLIRGQRGTTVNLTIARKVQSEVVPQILEIKVKRDKVPLESIKEARVLEGGVGYIRISDFKDNTARELRSRINEFLDEGMTAFVLDLRWNPGGLLTASKEVCELFLPRGSLVTYTRGRLSEAGDSNKDDMELYTERSPVLPEGFPMVVLVNKSTASSAEIVTGALQYSQRALIVGEKTFGKGSVQTIIPLHRPAQTALRLTTALYYTPAGVTIDQQGILPDVEVVMDMENERLLLNQLYESYKDDPAMINRQNHGSVTGNEVSVVGIDQKEQEDELKLLISEVYGDNAVDLLEEIIAQTGMSGRIVEDTPFLRAVEILQEDSVWDNLLQKYHKDVKETHIAADISGIDTHRPADRRGNRVQEVEIPYEDHSETPFEHWESQDEE